MRALTRTVAESPAFNRAIVVVLVINAIALGCRTAESVSKSLDPLLISVEAAVVAIFVAEMAIKITAFGGSFFRDPWNWFDLIVITVSAVPASGTLLMLRTVRILRTFRLISVIPSMRQVVNALFNALSGIMSILLLLALVLYTASIAAVQMFGAIEPEHFGHLGAALLTMFKVMTQGWPEVADKIVQVRPLGWLFFLGYIVLTGFIVLNLLIAVIVNAVERQMLEAREAKEDHVDQKVLTELAAVREHLTRLETQLRESRSQT